jgi:hypothetical protein
MANDVSTKAALISAKELPKLVDAAIAAAGTRGGTGPIVGGWGISGKWLTELETAHSFSESVAKHINTGGHPVAPALLSIDGRILAGFVERVALPQFREY